MLIGKIRRLVKIAGPPMSLSGTPEAPGNWGQVQKLTAEDPAADDHFGFSVAISGDTVVVGAIEKDSSTGAAYIFERNTGGPENWGEWGKLIVIDPQPGDQFGFAVAVHQDLALVGMPLLG